jgi:hypothetical protein
VNPVHAWAALQVYNIEKKQTGTGDIAFRKNISKIANQFQLVDQQEG